MVSASLCIVSKMSNMNCRLNVEEPTGVPSTLMPSVTSTGVGIGLPRLSLEMMVE